MEEKKYLVRYPRRRVIRFLLKSGIRTAFAALLNLEIAGRENLPKSGPLVIVANHFHFLDPLAMIKTLPYPAEFLGGLRTPNAPAWTELFRSPWGVLHVRRGGSSRDSLLAAQGVLEQGGVLVIFPEGGSWASVLRPPRPGAALLAARTAVPILPVGLDGLTDVFPALAKGRRTRVQVNIGKIFGPFQFSARDRSRRQEMEDLGHEMMSQISKLIPPARRGFYSDDPAIREAAKGTEVYPWDNQVEQ
jgi:1-acyl-sn-glycerol-3-phosphate acyltransferase